MAEKKASTSNAAEPNLYLEAEDIRPAKNIVQNHDFSGGLESWHPNCCNAFVAPPEPHYPEDPVSLPRLNGGFAVVTNRKHWWQGLEQNITDRVSARVTYRVCAWVAVSGALQGDVGVQATLKLENNNSSPIYLFIGSTSASRERWQKIEGSFGLSTVPHRVIFYLEGPSPGIDILIRSVEISCTSNSHRRGSGSSDGHENIIMNPTFDDGLNKWSGRGCKIILHDSMGDEKVLPKSGKFFASTGDRKQEWSGIQQDITGRVQQKLAYELDAVVRIFGNNINHSDVKATLWVQFADGREQYKGVGSVQATVKDWVQLQGKFLFNCAPWKAVTIIIHGPPSGTEILLNDLVVKLAAIPPPATPRPVIEVRN